jgi:signal recognition particle receptor subunit beta
MRDMLVCLQSSGKNLKVVDIPGHPRLIHSTLDSRADAAAGVVFMLDSSTFLAEKHAVAGCAISMHSLLITDICIQSKQLQTMAPPPMVHQFFSCILISHPARIKPTDLLVFVCYPRLFIDSIKARRKNRGGTIMWLSD